MVQYLDYSVWQRQWLESGEGARQLAYWQARLGCCLTYSRDLFDEPRIARMAEHWQQLLAGLLDNPQQRLCELPMLSSAEQQVLAGQLQGEQDLALDQTVHGLFAAQAARTLHAGALTFAGRHMTLSLIHI